MSPCRLYGDDTSLTFSSPNLAEIDTVINYDLEELHKWSNKWLMSFNPKKMKS